jgi:hypothetical protein
MIRPLGFELTPIWGETLMLGRMATIAGAIVAFTLATPAMAQEVDHAPDDRSEIRLTPYLWVAGTDGEIGIPRGDSEVEVGKSFADILGSLNFAFMGTLDVRSRAKS